MGGIALVPHVEVMIEPEAGVVVVGGDRLTIAGIVLSGAADEASARSLNKRRAVSSRKVSGPLRVAWAWTVDRLGDRLVDAVPGSESAAIRQLLA